MLHLGDITILTCMSHSQIDSSLLLKQSSVKGTTTFSQRRVVAGERCINRVIERCLFFLKNKVQEGNRVHKNCFLYEIQNFGFSLIFGHQAALSKINLAEEAMLATDEGMSAEASGGLAAATMLSFCEDEPFSVSIFGVLLKYCKKKDSD